MVRTGRSERRQRRTHINGRPVARDDDARDRPVVLDALALVLVREQARDEDELVVRPDVRVVVAQDEDEANAAVEPRREVGRRAGLERRVRTGGERDRRLAEGRVERDDPRRARQEPGPASGSRVSESLWGEGELEEVDARRGVRKRLVDDRRHVAVEMSGEQRGRERARRRRREPTGEISATRRAASSFGPGGNSARHRAPQIGALMQTGGRPCELSGRTRGVRARRKRETSGEGERERAGTGRPWSYTLHVGCTTLSAADCSTVLPLEPFDRTERTGSRTLPTLHGCAHVERESVGSAGAPSRCSRGSRLSASEEGGQRDGPGDGREREKERTVEELLDEVDVGEDHAAAAVALEPETIERLAA